ncbi:hypothetical protein [Nocardiopsis suaedae]|uniref:DUF2750 domain-containing protein n=1 Tax=Nocardiopsis suaedae TaxID=3018444 RepID=A0ABT4THF0_9ACTN|nr:hypothetical protein [Nocardiopsis suaedae]MDA2804133.1 hypothetical protein [Nocardiopsis suaedae]
MRHTPRTFTREIARREAEHRGVAVDWDAEAPEEVPEELRHAVFKVAERGWCVWATTSAEEMAMPADRDFHPLEEVLASGWCLQGWNGVRIPV